jgi:hypothetical protein
VGCRPFGNDGNDLKRSNEVADKFPCSRLLKVVYPEVKLIRRELFFRKVVFSVKFI